MDSRPPRPTIPLTNQATIVLILSVLVAGVVALTIPGWLLTPSVDVERGVYAVSRDDGPVSLSGEWLQVEGNLVSPEDWDIAPWQPGRVPSAVPGNADISYRLTIRDLDPATYYGLYLFEVASAYRVFANGELVAIHGAPGASHPGAVSFTPRVVFNLPRSGELQILIHATNRVQFRTGLWQGVAFGPLDEITGVRHTRVGVELFVATAILIAAAYHLILYALNTEDRSPLFFVLFCIPALLKVLLSGQQILLSSIAVENQLPWIRLSYQSVVAAVPLYLRYAHELFPQSVPKGAGRVFVMLALVQSMLVWLMPFPLLQTSFWTWNTVILIGFVFAIAWTIRAIRARESASVIAMVGLLFVIGFAVNDILFDFRLVQTGYFLSAGLFGFMLAQAVVIAVRYNAVFRELNQLQGTLEQQVRMQTEELREERNRLRELSRHDDTTGLINRRYGAELLQEEVARFLRYRDQLAIALIDLDHFKRINDTRGHAVGDDVLAGFARTLGAAVRTTDRVVRWGGEEFLLILPDSDGAAAEILARKILDSVAEEAIDTRDGQLSITFSAGICDIERAAADVSGFSNSGRRGTAARDQAARLEHALVEAMLRLADASLYQAKAEGRNRVVRTETLRESI